ncbi:MULTISPECIES: hypothetical protein [Kocuria]|uniref:hypothetical protein n=1 Tax=Kocuria TaxID=57493 RepID=UPI0020414E85|nr:MULTISPECIES: hypothetical protein [Kocuria]MCM3689438.1 hypothetical protein [Kocuria rosea]HST72389.1 hypothetical protein [Kocuria rosea]
MPFPDRVSRWAEEHPPEPAVVCGSERLGRREPHAAAARALLHEQEPAVGHLVAVEVNAAFAGQVPACAGSTKRC